MITKKIDNVTGLIETYKKEIIPAPISVKIELTAKCNLKCWFCATAKGLRQQGDMDFFLYLDIIKDLKESGVQELGLFYLGESYLYKYLNAAINSAKHIGFDYVFITTNGVVSTPKKLRESMLAGLDSLKFSFNWADSKQSKDMTGYDVFNKIISNIKYARSISDEVFKKTGHKCGIYASSIKYDNKQHEKMKEAVELIKPYVDEHYWLPLYNQAGLTSGVFGKDYVAGNIGRFDNPRDPIPCWSIFTEGHITYDGKLAACCFDHDGRFEMGDLTKTSFMEAWNSDKFRKLRKAHLNKKIKGTPCENCMKG